MTTNSLIRTNFQHWLNIMISNDTPYIRPIKQSKLNGLRKKNIAVVLPITRTPQLNNRAENQTVKKNKISAASSMYIRHKL